MGRIVYLRQLWNTWVGFQKQVGWTEYLWTSQARVKQTPLKCFPASHVTHPCSAGISSRTLHSTTTSQLLQLFKVKEYLCYCAFDWEFSTFYLSLRRRCGLYSGLGRVRYARPFYEPFFFVLYILKYMYCFESFLCRLCVRECRRRSQRSFNGNQMSWKNLLKSVLIELCTHSQQYIIHHSAWMKSLNSPKVC